MQQVKVELGQLSYPISVGNALLHDQSKWLDQVHADQILIVTNTTVASLYLPATQACFSNWLVQTVILPDGEEYKNLDSWSKIIDQLVNMRATRYSLVVALGGGVIGDMAGFAAASYMRGISVLQLPTTLLAMVDAAIGGKTGVNLPAGKNLVGAFHQPQQVVMDIDTLATLPNREYLAGIAEVIKYALIMDADFFTWLQVNHLSILNREAESLKNMIYKCAEYKAKVVSNDALETGQRALLNFGHTFGHALETLTNYQHWLHGEAVAIGMWMACKCGENMGITVAGTTQNVKRLLDEYGFDLTIPTDISTEQILESMRLDKKNQHAKITLILLESLGKAVIKKGLDANKIRPNISS